MADEKNLEKEELALDDANRVQVLSPGMMVAKRFFRNKLAITGLVIIVCMFLFAFLGGVLIPYTQSQVFYTTEEMKKDYAGATQIADYVLFPAVPQQFLRPFPKSPSKVPEIIQMTGRPPSILLFC